MPESHSEWHREVLPDGWARATNELASRSVLQGFYLAGGTGLALQMGHRRSVDLDLFSQSEFSPTDLRAQLGDLSGLRVRQVVRGTIHLELRDVLVSFLHYPYPLLFPLHHFEVLTVADPRDIACMKLDAIASRGSRRDFVGLYVAARRYGLREILGWFEQKYAAAPYNRVHLLKALSYFTDAEREPMPDVLVSLAWDTVKQFFLSEVPRVVSLPGP